MGSGLPEPSKDERRRLGRPEAKRGQSAIFCFPETLEASQPALIGLSAAIVANYSKHFILPISNQQ